MSFIGMLSSSQQSCSVKTGFVDATAGFEASAKPPASGRVATDSAIKNANIVRRMAIIALCGRIPGIGLSVKSQVPEA